MSAPVRSGLVRCVWEDWETHGRDSSLPGFRALAVYRFGVARMSVRPVWLRKLFSFVYWRLQHSVRNRYGIEVHSTATIGRRVLIPHHGPVVVHEFASVGDDCVLRQCVSLGAGSRWSPDEAPRLGKRVSVGAGAVIVGKVVIGDDVRIAPNAVVMRDVPSRTTVVSAPARVVAARFGGAA
jgi:serine O-acetyltransferase